MPLQTSKFREKIRKEYESFSYGVFEDIDAAYVLTNLAREASKTSGLVNNLSKWAGLQFLLWDAQMRVGISYEEHNSG
ncbi:dATP/dGTP pyrophosphohydrolase domain-containing protein [Pantoea sp. App145]|uniref:dATP/dGTP pyrophosphohydrolase domain-containing protein n=1 Tax=Pantoea sp. App145 TaxID=3071567 RepID=UPI003A803D04